ncbi:ABC transporter permease [Spirulina major]|uniref:ABC transporter permease n=1 Tax=Spirulina major TaxID=270636 RepID=UPI00093544B5|nr:ABC transporter permease [Spirulina major]
MVSLARRNLFEDLPRFLVAQAGIMFAVSLVTIQTGILQGFTRSTTLLIDQSKADLWITSDQFVYLELTEPIALATLNIAAEVDGVEKAEAVMRGFGRWYIPNEELTSVRIFGFDPQGELFVPGMLQAGKVEDLTQPDTILVDQSNLDSLHLEGVGDRARIDSRPTTVVGVTKDTQSIASSSYIFTSLENANAYTNSGFSSEVQCRYDEGDLNCVNTYTADNPLATPNPPAPEPLNQATPITFILIKATDPENLEGLKARLTDQLPGTKVFTTAELSDITRTYWQRRTGIGFILGLGTAVGVIVGMVIVGQILYASVSDHIKEFGTLKAMGASDRFIYSIIIEQALWMSVLGYLPGMSLCLGVSYWALTTQGILILITPLTAAGVLVVAMGMCVGSALFAIQKVTRVDPAIVFKA